MGVEFDKYLKEIDEKVVLLKDKNEKGSLDWYINWYADRFPFARIKYRAAGIGVLIIALAGAYGISEKDVLSLELLATVAALLVSLNAFFSWGTAWRVYFHAKVRLEFIRQAYEFSLIQARHQADDDKAIDVVNKALDSLMQNSGETIAEEAKSYFESLKFPSLKDVKG